MKVGFIIFECPLGKIPLFEILVGFKTDESIFVGINEVEFYLVGDEKFKPLLMGIFFFAINEAHL